jgi:uncharacterized protein (DUF362 family)
LKLETGFLENRMSSADKTGMMNRREAMLRLLQLGGAGAGSVALGLWLNSRSVRPEPAALAAGMRDHSVPADPNLPQLVVMQGEDPRALVRSAVHELGGMQRFIARGETVIVKPNIAWDRTPEQAANTNPQVVAEVVRQCWDAGAKKVIVTDVSCNDARRCFHRSGIMEAAGNEGAEVILPDPSLFREVNMQGEILQNWPVFSPFLKADKIINVPIAKHHSLSGATLGMKNWYGILGGNRSQLHQNIHQSLVDLAAFVRPTLTIVDCYRVLLRNGPTGGNLEDVAIRKTLVAGTDPVALDAYVAKAYWDLDHTALPYLEMAEKRGLGTVAFETLRMKAGNVG